MKRQKIIRLTLILIISALISGCENKTVLQSNNEIYSYTISGVELIFNFNSINGKQLTMNNGNGRSVGVYVVDNNNQSQIIFSDGWTWGHNSEVENDANFNHGEELKVTVVIYNSLGEAIVQFIEALGPDFLSQLENIWIQHQEEEIIILE